MNDSTAQQSQFGKVALVTGSNKGLGREAAQRLGHLGMTVLASARDEGRGQRTVRELQDEGIDVRCLRLDVTEEQSVQQAVDCIDEAFGRLDVLISYAGITVEEERPSKERPSTEVRYSAITVDQMRRTYEVNAFGVVAVTRAMLPLLRRAPAARVVNLSSPLGSLTLRADPKQRIAQVGLLAYSSSKAALNAIALHYPNELRDTGILVNVANPGCVATDLNTHAGHSTVEEGQPLSYGG